MEDGHIKQESCGSALQANSLVMAFSKLFSWQGCKWNSDLAVFGSNTKQQHEHTTHIKISASCETLLAPELLEVLFLSCRVFLLFQCQRCAVTWSRQSSFLCRVCLHLKVFRSFFFFSPILWMLFLASLLWLYNSSKVRWETVPGWWEVQQRRWRR